MSRSRRGREALVLAVAAVLGAGGCEAGGGAAMGGGPTRITTTTTTTPGPTTTSLPRMGALVTPSGVVVPIVSAAPTGWLVKTPCDRPAIVTGGTPVLDATVILDPGHGGTDPGAVSPGGLAEEPVNLDVSLHAKAALEAAGIPVLMTRTTSYDLELSVRAAIARNVAPRAFVSIHHNAEPDGPWPGPGSETYYQIASTDSKRLAGLIYEEVSRALARFPIAWVADRDAGAKYRQGRNGDFYAMLRLPSPVVSVLVELAFISNPVEAELLARADVRRIEGEAVARGIVRYLTTRDPGSGFTEPYPRPTPPGGGGAGAACTDPAL